MVRFKEASHYKKLPNRKVHCTLCPHNCIIGNGEVGKCKIRMNISGNLKSLNYGKPHTVKYVKVESFPLFHFLPESESLIVGNAGDNLEGRWYENEFSNKELEEIPTINQTPKQIIKQVEKSKINIVSYGYNEPTLSFEYLNDISDNSRRMNHILITNGFVQEKVVRELSHKISCAVVDIKSMNESFYENVLFGKLDPVLRTAKILHDNKVWVEIRMTLLPNVHEDYYDVRKLVAWMLNNLDSNTPLHFIAYNKEESINPEVVVRSRKIAKDAGLNYVYTHGVNFPDGETTWCPNCKKSVIEREDGRVDNFIKEGKCGCGKEIAGIWD